MAWFIPPILYICISNIKQYRKTVVPVSDFTLNRNIFKKKVQEGQKFLICYRNSPLLFRTQEVLGLPWWLSWLRICLQCRRSGFSPWVGKISWKRAWQLTPVFLIGESAWTEEPGGLQSIGSQSHATEWMNSTAHGAEGFRPQDSAAWQELRGACMSVQTRTQVPVQSHAWVGRER